MSIQTTAATRFDSFNFYQTSYKKIGDHSIEVDVLVPKHLAPGKHPLFVKWHGGGLVSITMSTSQAGLSLTWHVRPQGQQHIQIGSQPI